MSSETPIAKIRQHFGQLKQERTTWEPYWLEAQEYVAPQRGRSLRSGGKTETNNGYKDTSRRLSGVASRALGVLASGMQSGLTSKARQWFLLGHPDPELNRYHPVREWYGMVQEVLEGVFRRSNIYTAFLHTYNEMAAFGQGAMAIYSHPDKTLFCRPHTVGTYYMSSDMTGEIDTFFYTEWLTATQLVEEYGKDVLPDVVTNAYNTGRYTDRFEVVHGFLKHPERYGIQLGEVHSVASVHFLASAHNDDKFLRKSGYKTWPVMTPRWDVIDQDVYGWSPTRDVIDDVKMVMAMERDAMKGTAKAANPPWRIPPELDRRGLDTRPGALNPVSSMSEHAVAPLFTQMPNLQQLQYKIDSVKQDIKDGYYNSLFLALLSQDNPQMTAREVAERHEEKLLMLGPVLERIHMELLDPAIDRAFAIAWDAGLIPPPPAELEGEPTQVEYVSILSQAQKAVGVNRIEQSVGFLGSVSQIYPEARHLLNVERTVREYSTMIGAPAVIFKSADEYAKAVQAEKQDMQNAQNAAMGEQVAQSVKALGDTDPANVQALLSGGTGGLVL
jgi:hypothetical protein